MLQVHITQSTQSVPSGWYNVRRDDKKHLCYWIEHPKMTFCGVEYQRIDEVREACELCEADLASCSCYDF